jgi:threonine dehydrogenase-like Zn-dependent dehydrogenase
MRGIAAFPGSESPRFVDAPEPPPPAAGQVVCRTLELGICGTDREILRSRQPWIPPNADHLVLGHECLARVEAVGPNVTGVAPGDLVVPTVRRAHAGATRRVDMLAFGQFIERGIVCEHGFSFPWWLDEPRHLYPIQPESRDVAVLTEPFAVAEKAIHEALVVQQARLGDQAWTDPPPRVLVTGLGPIGFAAAAISVCRGWPTTLYGRDRSDGARAMLAVELGASYLAAGDGDRGKLEPALVERDGYDLVLECTGSDELMVRAAHAMASLGVMVWLGSDRTPEPAPLNVAQMMRDGLLRNHIHIGSVNAAPRDFQAAIGHIDQLRRERPGPLARLITARVPPADALWHYEHRQRQGIKTVVIFDF